MTSRPGSMRLGVVDSDTAFVKVLSNRLESAGYEHRVLSGGVPLDELVAMRLNALIVDPQALRTDPWDFIERAGAMLPGIGLLICAHESTVAQRVRGLRLGADDWIAKPCHPEEVVARVEAVVRRHRRGRAVTDAGPLVAGELEIRPDQFEAFVAGNPIGLTRREFELLHVLAEATGRVVPRDDIYQRAWGYAMAHGDRSVDVFVRKLRSKLERHSPGWRYIHTHFGIGYRFDPEPLDASAADSLDASAAESREADAGDRLEAGARSQAFHSRDTAA